MNFIFGMITGILITILTIIITAFIIDRQKAKQREKALDGFLSHLTSLKDILSNGEETPVSSDTKTSSDEIKEEKETNE